ncbi:MAG: hypothetical protein M1837_001211 [Sclerophora amabilis]|nr:MAG: hypothetical protein M1837_001211 [Sclerophora amabilis]
MKSPFITVVVFFTVLQSAQARGHYYGTGNNGTATPPPTPTTKTVTVTCTTTVSTCPPPSPCTTGTNPVVNPGFEDETLAPWSIYRYLNIEATVPTDDPSNARSGSKYWRFRIFTPGGYAFPTQSAIPLPSSSAPEPRLYSLILYAKVAPPAPSASDSTCSISISVSKSAPLFGLLASTEPRQLDAEFTNYTQVSTGPFSVDDETDDEVTRVDIGISLYCNTEEERVVSVDDVSLSVVCPI